MPKDNNQTQNPQNNTASVTDDMPPIMMEDTHPPMINEGKQATVINDQPLPTVAPPITDSGSAAPADDIVMPSVVTSGPNSKSPTKKFGGGKVIATILGLFLLVGGVGAGVMLTQQNQDIREQASGGCSSNTSRSSCESSCGSPKADGKTYTCRWSTEQGACKESGNVCTNGTGEDNSREEITGGNCGATQTVENGWFQCGSGTGGPDCTFCLKASNRTCNEVLASRQCNVGGFGSCKNISGEVEIYYCQGNPPPDTSLGCQEKDPLPAGVSWDSTNKSITGSFCGTVQVDDKDSSTVVFCSRTDTSGCGTSTTPPATTPPAISAACQDVKAYSTNNWTLLTPAVLSTLKAGDSVNFCVTGSASSGSFNKARFTINGSLLPETTTVRPGGTDFCQLYVIPAGATNFVVMAQINHITLGWK